MNPTSHRPELDLLRRQVADLARELAERDRVLHERTRHLQVAQALAHLGSWNWDIASGRVEWSDELYRIFGYEPQSREMTFDSFVSAVLPDDHDRVLVSFDDALAGVAPYDMECRIVRPDGEVRTIHCCGEVVRDGSSQPLRMSGTALDITDRKQTELALQQREAHFRALIEHSSDVITVLDPDGAIRFESPSFERLLGYAQHELDGRIAFEFVHQEDLPVVIERFRLLIQRPGEPQTAEFRFRHKDGSWRSFEGIGRAIYGPDGRCSVIVNSRDITQRKRTETMLRTSQERLRQALQASGTGLWDWNTETNEVALSQEWKGQLGYEPTEISDSFETWTAHLHPDDRERAAAYARDYVSRREGEYRQEFRLRHRDGTYRWIEARASFVPEADGRSVRLLGSHTDITDRKRMEESVQESEEWYRTLVELSPSGVFVFSEGRTVYVNHTGAVLLGAKKIQEILDRPTFEIIHPDYHEQVRENVQRLLSGGVSVHSAERTYLKMDGTPIPVQVEAARITWNGKPAILGLFSDITERKRGQDRVREMNLALAQAMPGISRVDVGGRYLEVNQPYAAMLGYEPSELLGRTWEPTIHPEDLCIAQHAYEQLLEKGKAEFECRAVRKDGSIFFTQVLMVSSKPSIGGAFGHHCFMRDITERKRTEKALADLNATLEQQVCDRTEALRQSEERFRQFFDYAPNVTALKDHNGRYVYTNRQFDKIFRLSPGMAIGKTDEELFSPEQAAQFQSHDQQVLLNGWGQEFEEVTQQEDGSHTSIVVRFPVTDASGRLSALGVIATDVTERKRTQEALRESEVRFQQFAESVGSAFWIADLVPDGETVVYANAAFTRIRGIAGEELSQSVSRWLDSIHPDDRTRVEACRTRFISGGLKAEFDCEYRIVDRDGRIRWISDRRVKMAGWGHRVAGIAEDITDHRQQLALLAQTEAVGKIGGWEIDFLTNHLWWSDETYRLHDTTPELYSPTVDTAMNFYTPESRPVIADALQKGVKQGEAWDHELELITAKRRRIAIRVVGKVDVVNGRTVRAYGTFQDITERKRAEEALRKVHDELERKVVERTAELQASEERYTRATAIGKVGVWELDVLTGQYHGDANLKALFGYTREELSTDPYAWLNLVHPDDQPIAMKNWELVQCGAADACHYELRHIKKDGSIVWGDVRAHTVRDQNGQLTNLIGATVDITERKRIEDALRDSEERFAKAFRTSPHPIGITEMATGRCIEVNDACLELFGFRREEVIGNTTLMLGVWPNPEDRARLVERLKAGEPVRNMEFALRTKSGPLRYLLTSCDLVELNGTPCLITVGSDITERKRAEEALRISEERFAKAFQASPHPVVISEVDSGRVLDTNDAACQLFGYHKEEVVGRTTLQIGLWPSTQERDRFVEQLKSSGSVRNMEVTLQRKDGDVRQCLLSSELIELNGKPCSVTVGDDITERKRMERALRRTQFSVDQAVEAILWVDQTGRIFNVNETACRMLGYTRQDLTAITVHDIDPNFPVERWPEHWSHVKEQGALAFEAKFWSRTGGVLETDVTVNYLQYEGKEYGCMILRDIGERKRAEAERRRSHTFLRQVIDTDPDFIFAKDREGRFTMANKAVADWYGTTVENLIGKSDADFNNIEEEVAFFRQSDLEVIHSGRDQFAPEERITDAGGRTRWLQTIKRPIFDDQGRVHMVLGAATDITERKRMEEILLQRERDLSAALQERERISQDLHDGILQSLYAVGLGLEACKPLIKKQQDHVTKKFMATLEQAIGQLNQVMTEIRNFIAGLESQVMQGGDFSTALRTMVETMSVSCSARCRVKIDDAAARRLSTEQALHIINIVREGLSNALRHSRAKQITVSLRDLARSDRLAVTDDGIGFNARSVQGVGHGLVNMAARAQKVRGLFAIQSKPDKGTRISLDLPKDAHYAHN